MEYDSVAKMTEMSAVQTAVVLLCFSVYHGSSKFAYPEKFKALTDPARLMGWPSETGQIPYQLSLRIVDRVGSIVPCAGSIIHAQFGLTAAHCIAGRHTIMITAGSSNLTRPALVFDTTSYYIHPLFDENTPDVVQTHDIGLINFGRTLEFSTLIQPVRLQRVEDMNKNYEGMRMIASGWSVLPAEPTSTDSMNWVYLRGISNAECLEVFGSDSVLEESTLCARWYNYTPHTNCVGDGGGPLTIYDENDGLLTQVGVASFVYQIGCHTGLPTGFVRPGYYHDWLTAVTGHNFDWNYKKQIETIPIVSHYQSKPATSKTVDETTPKIRFLKIHKPLVQEEHETHWPSKMDNPLYKNIKHGTDTAEMNLKETLNHLLSDEFSDEQITPSSTSEPAPTAISKIIYPNTNPTFQSPNFIHSYDYINGNNFTPSRGYSDEKFTSPKSQNYDLTLNHSQDDGYGPPLNQSQEYESNSKSESDSSDSEPVSEKLIKESEKLIKESEKLDKELEDLSKESEKIFNMTEKLKLQTQSETIVPEKESEHLQIETDNVLQGEISDLAVTNYETNPYNIFKEDFTKFDFESDKPDTNLENKFTERTELSKGIEAHIDSKKEDTESDDLDKETEKLFAESLKSDSESEKLDSDESLFTYHTSNKFLKSNSDFIGQGSEYETTTTKSEYLENGKIDLAQLQLDRMEIEKAASQYLQSKKAELDLLKLNQREHLLQADANEPRAFNYKESNKDKTEREDSDSVYLDDPKLEIDRQEDPESVIDKNDAIAYTTNVLPLVTPQKEVKDVDNLEEKILEKIIRRYRL